MQIIGVDAGGTKTEAATFAEQGMQIAQALEGTGNLVVDKPAALAPSAPLCA